MQEFRILVLGVRFVLDEHPDNSDPTIEDYYRRMFVVDGELTLLDVIDTSGCEEYQSLNETWIQSSHGFLLLFSLTQQGSLGEVDHFRKQILDIKGDDLAVPIVIAGTKLDLTVEREVRRNIIHSLAVRWDLPFYETSAKHNWNINDVFEDLVRQMRKRCLPAPKMLNYDIPADTAFRRSPHGCVIT
ncbi:ras-domain-containing protein [Macrolepiota fuliginosa MF-IS2]|uniref:Ras-domain-containing protein n=1 Tax=Macrolepiota fuliginosa MF-IS2 TaxID=1400762 RepID=A0A9P6BW28_9AGAR|nr:ras-domain-containing protein [Macrolepiota fuliginosa MF-IS2]